MPCLSLSCLVLLCHALSYFAMPCLTLACLLLLCHALSYFVMSCFVLHSCAYSCPVVSCPSCPIFLPISVCHALSYFVMSSCFICVSVPARILSCRPISAFVIPHPSSSSMQAGRWRWPCALRQGHALQLGACMLCTLPCVNALHPTLRACFAPYSACMQQLTRRHVSREQPAIPYLACTDLSAGLTLPPQRHVLCGTSSGQLKIYDLYKHAYIKSANIGDGNSAIVAITCEACMHACGHAVWQRHSCCVLLGQRHGSHSQCLLVVNRGADACLHAAAPNRRC